MESNRSSVEASSREGVEAAWSMLTELLARLSSAEDQGAFLERCLEDLLEVVGADRAIALGHSPTGSLYTLLSRSRGRALEAAECEEISRTVTRRALVAKQCVVLRPLEDADASKSMVAWGIRVAMAAPMRAVRWVNGAPHDEAVGVLYVDFRASSRKIGHSECALLQATAHVLGASLFSYRRLERATEALRELTSRVAPADPDLDESLAPPSMALVRREVASCLHGDGPIPITGESGTGKTQLARAIAKAGARTPVVRAVLGSSDDLNTITSELFGHERGAFSGALAKRVGLVELADGGTLIFDEMLNLPAYAQQLLLDFTQFGTYRPLGYDKREPKRANVRMIAATNGDLAAAVAAGRFREDLYYRIAGAVLEIPPLRERRHDVPHLADTMIRRLAPQGDLRLSPEARRSLVDPDQDWPGNVRQLESVVRRATERAIADGSATVEVDHLRPGRSDKRRAVPAAASVAPAPTTDVLEEYKELLRQRALLDSSERTLLQAALSRYDGVIAHLARDLGVARTSLSSRLESLGIGRPGKHRPVK